MDGQQVLNPDGQPFYEYFGVELETQLKLSPGEAEGDYQLAVLADDGSMIRLHTDTGDQVLVDDDGVHPTEMGCATDAVHMTSTTKLPIQIRYHQGPRYHISLVVMWRPMPADSGDVADPMCGQMGNDLYFDSTTTPPNPQTPYYDLLARGWKVLEGTNFELPEADKNPCVLQEDPLEITNLSITSITSTSMVLTWTTNIASSSQVQYKVVATGATTLTAEDTTLTTNHSFTLTGLSSNTLYAVKAFSTSQSLQTAQSDERAVRTQR